MNEQSNTQFGPVQVIAGDALTGLEGYLVFVTNASGTAKAYLPNAVTDEALYVVLEGAAAGSYASLQPLANAQQARAELNGTVAIGARLKLETPDGTEDGKVATIGSTAGVYFSPGIALETGVDGQLVLFRPDPRMVTIASAAISDPTGGATTDAEARTAINSIVDALQAAGIVATS
ncbi:MAG: hypothetical protein HN904_05690 [Victivallales bacterium]|nr:hypothetical protein [Victivallales bacterium]MBT7162250.1 hypothetical protein [Victivallales bacterium]